MLPTDRTNLSNLTTHWQNRSLSSVVSDTATFHSAQGRTSPIGMELSRLESSNPHSPLYQTSTIPSKNSPHLESAQMSRQDSGFSEGITSSRRTSTSSTSRRHSKRYSNPSNSSRPSAKRAPRSSPGPQTQTRASISSSRPNMRTRHTVPYPTPHQQFFQFPTLPASTQELIAETPPPPPTCQYWTSDSTRRLEYAAIDAAGRGVRGFVIKLLPDCILPPKVRRPRFHEEDAESDAGSVRRYRLSLPEEKVAKRPGLLKRWTSFGRGGSSS